MTADADRNPAVDPRRGDIVRSTIHGNGRERHVTGRNGDDVGYYAISPTQKKLMHCTLRAWQRWCKSCVVRVIQVGP